MPIPLNSMTDNILLMSDLDIFIDEMESHGYVALKNKDGKVWFRLMKELGVVFDD